MRCQRWFSTKKDRNHYCILLKKVFCDDCVDKSLPCSCVPEIEERAVQLCLVLWGLRAELLAVTHMLAQLGSQSCKDVCRSVKLSTCTSYYGRVLQFAPDFFAHWFVQYRDFLHLDWIWVCDEASLILCDMEDDTWSRKMILDKLAWNCMYIATRGQEDQKYRIRYWRRAVILCRQNIYQLVKVKRWSVLRVKWSSEGVKFHSEH